MAKIGKKIITASSYLIAITVGFGAGGYVSYEYMQQNSTSNQMSQQLDKQVSGLEREVKKLHATIRELEEASEKKASDPGDLTFYNELPKEEVSPEPLETGKAMKIGSTITPNTTVSHDDDTHMHNLTSTLDELNKNTPQHTSETSHITEKNNNFNKVIPADANDMNAEVAKQAISPVSSNGQYRVQAGSFQREADAQAMQHKLKQQNIESAIRRAQVSGNTWYRVQVGPYSTMNDAKTAKTMLKSMLKGDLLIVKSAR